MTIFLLIALALLLLPLKWIVGVLLAALIHELGHYAALRLCGVEVSGMSVGIDGARICVGEMNRRQELLCAMAGPLAGIALFCLRHYVPRTGFCALIHSLYNLLPIYPLDGGRVLHCIGFHERISDTIEWLCIVLIGLAGVYGCIGLHLGLLPVLIAGMTIHRALAGKVLAIRSDFRYNRGRKRI